MKRRSTAALLVLALAAMVALAAGCGGFPGDSPAKVGDVYIDGAEFTSQVESYAAQYGITKETQPDMYNDLSASILDSMVATELAVQMAADLGIDVTDEEIQESVDSIVNDYYEGDEEALITDLKADFMDMDDLRAQIRNYLLAGSVQDQIIQGIDEPTDEEIEAYYEQNKTDFLTDEAISARHILISAADKTVRSSATTTESTTTTTEPAAEPESTTTTSTDSTTTTTLPELDWARALATAAQMRADLLDGASWNTLAARYSDDADTKDKGGDLGVVAPGSLIDVLGREFDNALFSMDVDQISEPIRTEYGYEVIQITKITEPQQKTLDEARADILLILTGLAEEDAWTAFIEAAKLKIGVVYRDGYEPTTTTELVPTTLAP